MITPRLLSLGNLFYFVSSRKVSRRDGMEQRPGKMYLDCETGHGEVLVKCEALLEHGAAFHLD